MAGDMELPSDLLESMERLETTVNKCDELLKSLTKLPLLDTKKKLEPIEKARLDLTVAYSVNSLFWAYLVTQGINATEHPIKNELDRIKTYMSKLKDTEEKVKGATLKVDKEAAKRFIKSALWTEKDKTEPTNSRKEEESEQEQSTLKEKDLKRKENSDGTQSSKKKKKKIKQE